MTVRVRLIAEMTAFQQSNGWLCYVIVRVFLCYLLRYLKKSLLHSFASFGTDLHEHYLIILSRKLICQFYTFFCCYSP